MGSRVGRLRVIFPEFRRRARPRGSYASRPLWNVLHAIYTRNDNGRSISGAQRTGFIMCYHTIRFEQTRVKSKERSWGKIRTSARNERVWITVRIIRRSNGAKRVLTDVVDDIQKFIIHMYTSAVLSEKPSVMEN